MITLLNPEETRRETGKWTCHTTLTKFDGDWTSDEIAAGLAGTPIETIEVPGNILVTAGLTALMTLLIGGGGTAFNNANSYLGVGDSTTAAAIGQTDLQAVSNKFRKAMDVSFPSVAANVATFRSTFATTDANFAWQEWGVFNGSSGGTMLNRKVENLGTKTSAQTWQLTITVTIS